MLDAQLANASQLLLGCGFENHILCAINFLANLAHLRFDVVFIFIHKGERTRRIFLDRFHDETCQIFSSLSTICKGGVDSKAHAQLFAVAANEIEFFICIGREAVQAYYDSLAEGLDVLNVLVHISQSALDALEVRRLDLLLIYTAVHLQRGRRSYEYGQLGRESGLATLNVEELLHT